MLGQRAHRATAHCHSCGGCRWVQSAQADEEGTLSQWKALWGTVIEPKIKEHRGRIARVIGDGILAEFASVIDAVRCAVEVQRSVAERNANAPQDKRIEFRVGINFGELIIEDGDFWGDGVNIVARLEALANPGGSARNRKTFLLSFVSPNASARYPQVTRCVIRRARPLKYRA